MGGAKVAKQVHSPFVIEKISSSHLAILRNPDTNVCLKTPVHFNRLKMASVREPNPTPYFISKVVTHELAQQTDTCTDAQSAHNASDRHDVTINAETLTDEQRVEYTVPNLRRSTRTHNPQDRFGINVHLDTVISSDESFRDGKGHHKVKCFLGQQPCEDSTEYLVQFKGEPTENAFWISHSSLNTQARNSVQKKPPPVIINVE